MHFLSVREKNHEDLFSKQLGSLHYVSCVGWFILYLQNENSDLHTGDGSVDIHGKPVLRSNTGNWRACPFILGNLSYFFIFFSFI